MNLLEIWNGWLIITLCSSPFVLMFVAVAIKRESENRQVKRQVEEWESYRLKMRPVLEQEQELAYLPVEKAQAALRELSSKPLYPLYEAESHRLYETGEIWREDLHGIALHDLMNKDRPYAQAQNAMRKSLLEDLRMAQDKYYQRRAEIEAERAEIDTQVSRAYKVLRSRSPQPPYIPTEAEILADQQALFAASTMMALGGMMMSDQGPFDH